MRTNNSSIVECDILTAVVRRRPSYSTKTYLGVAARPARTRTFAKVAALAGDGSDGGRFDAPG